MSLAPGARLGAYEILSLLGVGGMGEVYRARDTRLNRDVAIKVLPEAFVHDVDRLARFKREAQLLASMNHPHICALYHIADAPNPQSQIPNPDQIQFLVLELVEGPTLADRIAHGPIPFEDALPIARQIAEALEAAHEQGIIHRDLKPANIKLTADGQVKVLDFGLAKALDVSAVGRDLSRADLSLSPTITSPAMTMGGVILGTAAYMSPEQARGKVVDKRTDIWAFGCVVFEMLTGKSAFVGDDVSLTLSKILQREAEWAALPPDTPPRVVELLSRCLKKDPRERLRDIGDARSELQDSVLMAGPGVALTSHAITSKRARIASAIAVLAVVAAAFAGGYALRRENTPAPLIRFSIPLPSGHALLSGPAITRDGRRIAYVSSDGTAPQRLYVKQLEEFEGRAIAGTEGATQPFFSPDGRWIAFFAKGRLFKLDLEGGAPIELADAPSPVGGTWREDDTLVFTTTWNGGLYRMSSSGGTPEVLIRPDKKPEYAYTWPYFLPGGNELLFTTWGTSFSISRLSLPDLERTIIAPGFGNSAAYAVSGHVLPSSYAGQLQAIPYREGTPVGRASPVTVVDKVHWAGLPGSGEAAFGVSLNGTLVYAPGDITQRSLVFVDQTGHATPADRQQHAYSWISLSPDGRKAAAVYDGKAWIQDHERGLSTPLAPELRSGHQGFPVWTRDGSRVIFASQHEGNWDLYSTRASGAGSAEVVLKKELDQFPLSTAPDGTLIFAETRPGAGNDIWVLPPGGPAAPWLATPAEEVDARVSPSGHLIVYSSDESGRREIYLRGLRGAGERVQVSTDGGMDAVWSPNGNRIFYRQGNAIMAVDVMAGERLTLGKPSELFNAGWKHGTGRHSGNRSSFAALPDGKRFLMLHYEPAAIPTRINVILNWFDELKRKVPAN